MTQSCWLSSEPLLVLSRVDLLFASSTQTNVFQASENDAWLVCFTVVNCSLTNGQAGNLIFFVPHVGPLY